MDCLDFYNLQEAYLNIYEESEKETHLESTEEMSSDKDKRRARMERKSKDKKKREHEDYNESLDYYDDVLSYLIDEGYADTIENAEVIMVNMSEAWIDSILEVTRGGFIPKGDNRYYVRKIDEAKFEIDKTPLEKEEMRNNRAGLGNKYFNRSTGMRRTFHAASRGSKKIPGEKPLDVPLISLDP